MGRYTECCSKHIHAPTAGPIQSLFISCPLTWSGIVSYSLMESRIDSNGPDQAKETRPIFHVTPWPTKWSQTPLSRPAQTYGQLSKLGRRHYNYGSQYHAIDRPQRDRPAFKTSRMAARKDWEGPTPGSWVQSGSSG